MLNINKRWRRWFKCQLSRWLDSDIISSSQAQEISSLYDKNFGPDIIRVDKSWFIRLSGLLGAILIGLGVILFFASNWQYLSAQVKVSLILSAVVITYWLGYQLSFQWDHPRIGGSLIFLGHLFYGSSIWLIAQIFHLNVHYPAGVLYWAVGVMGMSWALSLTPGLVLSALLLLLWVWMEKFIFHLPVYGYWLFFVPLVGLIYKKRSRAALLLALISAQVWLFQIRLPGGGWSEENLLLMPPLLFGLLAYWLADIHCQTARWPKSAPIYRWIFILSGLGLLYPLTFHSFNENFGEIQSFAEVPHSVYLVPVFLLAAAVVTAGVYLFKKIQQRRGLVVVEAFVALLVIVLVALWEWTAVPALGYTIAMNLVLFGITFGLIAKCYQQGEISGVVGSLVLFGLLILARYFDLAFSLLPRSLFFVGGGIVLLFVSLVLEKQRRKLVASMESSK